MHVIPPQRPPVVNIPAKGAWPTLHPSIFSFVVIVNFLSFLIPSYCLLPALSLAHPLLAVREHVELHPAHVPDHARPLHYQLPVPLLAQDVELRRAAAAAARLRDPADHLPVVLLAVEHRHVLAARLEPRARKQTEVSLERQNLCSFAS